MQTILKIRTVPYLKAETVEHKAETIKDLNQIALVCDGHILKMEMKASSFRNCSISHVIVPLIPVPKKFETKSHQMVGCKTIIPIKLVVHDITIHTVDLNFESMMSKILFTSDNRLLNLIACFLAGSISEFVFDISLAPFNNYTMSDNLKSINKIKSYI